MRDEIRTKIDNADVVSFDVFDTLLARKVAHPQDVFVLAQELFNERSKFHIETSFPEMRYKAEYEARADVYHKKVDITIDEIYVKFSDLYGFNGEFCDELKKYEFLAEKIVAVANPSIKKIYNYAVKSGKKILIISDMYLLKDQVATLLKKAGYKQWDKLIVSSEDGTSKSTGSSFASAIKSYPNQTIVHIGDNIVSDVSWPSKFGIDTIHIHKNIENLSFERDPAFRAVYSGDRFRRSLDRFNINLADTQADVITGLSTLYMSSDKVSTNAAVGYTFFGPLLLSFVQWIQDQALRGGVDHLYFLARDGAIMKQAYELFYGDSGLKSTYTIGSRRVMNFPALHKELFDTDGIDGLVGSKEINIKNLLQGHGLNIEDASTRAVLDAVGLGEVETVSYGEMSDRLKAALHMLSDDIKSISKNEAVTVRDYLRSIGMTKAKAPMLVDIGWNGSMQLAIGNILNTKPRGLYFGIYNTHKSKRLGSAGVGYFDARIGNAEELGFEELFRKGGILILESLFTNPDQASFISLKKLKDGTYKGVEGEWDNPVEERQKVKEIHDAALKFISDFSSLDLPRSLKTLRRDVVIWPLQMMVERPTDEIAKMFGYVGYSDVSSSVPLYIGAPAHDAAYYRLRKNDLNREFAKAFWKEGFIRNCLALGIKLPKG